MKGISKWGAFLAVAVAAFSLGQAFAKGGKKAATVWPAESIKWADGPAKGVKVAGLWGDMAKGGAYGALLKFDAGLMHSLHRHSQTLKIVVISGTFVFTPEGGTESKLGPGSYFATPGGMKHVSGCAAGADCTFFMTSSDKFDMTMAEGGK